MSNKDEALRAKGLAEDWMSKSDFTTARRVAVKAQKMDETLENISHMIMVCDVHIAAQEKSGDETDWYKILQVELNADENTIKKQYRKFALHLHPDKNKLPGAEAAFKMIGEAQRVLLDKDKRRLHDMKRKPFKRHAAPVPSYQQPQHAPPPPQQPRGFYTAPVFQSNVNVNAARNSFTAAGLRPESQPKPQAQPSGFGESRTFWTFCAFCHRRHECVKEFLHKQVMCPSCGKQSVAFQTAFQAQPAQPAQPTFSFYQQSKAPTQEAVHKQPESSVRVSPRKEASKAKSSGSSAEQHINGNGKRKKIVESSSESSYDWEEVAAGGQHSRRSVRSKQKVSYEENVCDGGKKEENNLFAKAVPNGKNRKEKAKDDQVGSSRSSGSSSDVEILECADPDFTNFEKLREESCFKAGQVWAMYDDMGKMPRYYANIRKVIREPKFMLKITWLEHKQDDERSKAWFRRKLPVSVGKYQLGGDDNISDTPSFSHLIHCRVRGIKDIVCVYPRIGETWALFKNWDINWLSPSRRHEYKYEFVEVLSEYAEGVPITVAFLRKVKGFASVFRRVTAAGGVRSNTFQIPPHEMLRFSHSIPSAKLTGKERSGVPVGSYELDTAALPQMIEECEEEAVPVQAAKSSNQARHHRSPPSSEPDCIVIPNYEFHDFSGERSEGKFTVGQIWSLNCKEEGLPKYYAKIQKVEWRPVFKLQINKLELESLPANATQWRDKRMPVTCGNFTLKEGQRETLTQVTSFSHEIKAHESSKNKYTILPKTGDIWAMYKNWSDAINVGSLKKCAYDVVEVLDDDESHIEVMMLERVDGFTSVFKEKVEGGMDVRKMIPRSEVLRFSHYVPRFRLTGEKGGALRGYVELDSTALSRNLLRA
ncbi:unnamed protein product [Eruca vesicaria subsp. sativa]|uniref:J domain-containing protein n=1 Tax=Eruca vesicaria subsp. sativa TaxID=29727 RepID=A0ABC8M7P9_ERUVS|nr:unnamed protein product [Eruca vesicaria subsp. sativa]